MKYNDQGFYDNNSDEWKTESFGTEIEPDFEQSFEQTPESPFEQVPYRQTYGQPDDEPTYNQTYDQSFEQPTYEQPFGQPYEQPSYDQPFEQPYGQPYEQQSYGQSFEEAFEPTFEEPFEQRTYTDTSRSSVMKELSQPLNPNAEPDDNWNDRRAEERRRAAVRRRKAEEKRLRRQKRMIQAIIRCSILLLGVILIIVGVVKMISGAWKHFHKDKKPDKKTEQMASTEETTEAPAPKVSKKIVAKELPADKEAALEIIKKLSEEDTDMKSIYDNAAVYPEKILRYLAVNPEMTEFVLNYPAKIAVTFDGEFEVTVSEKKVPLFLQYDEQWGYADYGNELIATDGSAPTCLSMAYTYLLQDGTKNPIKVADYAVSKGYLSEEGVTSEKLMTEGATDFGMTSEELPLEKKKMQKALEDGKLIICKMKDGDFTKTEQYILMYKCKDGLFYLNDPSSAARSDVPWAYDRLSDQIDKMWVLSK